MEEFLDEWFIGAFIAVTAGIYSFFRSFTILKQKHMIANIPTSKIRSLAIGKVEIYGTIKRYKDIIVAPFSGKECLYCNWTVEKYRSDKDGGKWEFIASGQEGQYFNLEDDTGNVLVSIKGAEVELPICYQTKKLKNIPASIRESLDINKWSGFFGSYRFREYFLIEGDSLYIMGFADDNPFVEEGTGLSNEADLMIQQQAEEFFYISDKSEKEVLSKKQSDFIGSLIAGFVLIIGGLLIIFAKLNIL